MTRLQYVKLPTKWQIFWARVRVFLRMLFILGICWALYAIAYKWFFFGNGGFYA